MTRAERPSVRKLLRLLREVRGIVAARQAGSGFLGLPSAAGFDYLALPGRIWRTKSYEFWIFLGTLLYRARPRSLLELGSGRSTIYLSEYAGKCGAALVSIEQSRAWAELGNTICRYGGMPERYVHHVPLAGDGYYAIEHLRRLVTGTPELLYLDGPHGDRSGLVRHDYMLGLCRAAKIIVLDDVQWRSVYDQMETISDAGGPAGRLYFRYPASASYDNYVAVLLAPPVLRLAEDIVEFLGLPALRTLGRDACVER